MKTYKTNTAIYAVNQNEDGTLNISREYLYKGGNWRKDGNPIQNAGMFINQQGGIEGLLNKCTEIGDIEAYVKDLNEACEERKAAAQIRIKEEADKVVADYKRLFSGEVTESNEETISALLRYLNTMNWGMWSLPKMTIGYACHQYDCDGKTATTIKLDSPIMIEGEPCTMFETGAPFGHLNKYRAI